MALNTIKMADFDFMIFQFGRFTEPECFLLFSDIMTILFSNTPILILIITQDQFEIP